MRRRILSAIMIAMLIAGMFVLAFNIKPVKAAPNIKVVFRLLAIDGYTYSSPDSAQQLIDNLTSVGLNWQNASYNGYDYTSYIHLLTNSSYSSTYRVDQTTPANINSEMTGFLAATGPGESNNRTVRILYYNGHGGYDGSKHYYFCWPKDRTNNIWPMLINDTQLATNLNHGDLGKSNCTLIILDTCYSQGFLSTLAKAGRIILAACGPAWDESYAWTGATPAPGYWAAFTGNRHTAFNSTYTGPVGILGAIKDLSTDTDGDGWYSAGEVFVKAKATVFDYEKSNTVIRTWSENGKMVTHPIQNCTDSIGVVNGEIPFVMYTQTVNGGQIKVTFPYNAAPFLLVVGRPWSMWHNNALRNGFTPSFGPPTSLLWNTSFFDSFFDSVAVADGCAFVGTLGGGGGGGGARMYALSLANGAVLWSFAPADGQIKSSPAVANGTVIFATTTGRIYGLYEATGLPKWEYMLPVGESIVSSPCLANNTVFIGSMAPGGGGGGGRLYALNMSSGVQFYNFTSDSAIYSSPAVADGKVFFGTNGTWPVPNQHGFLYALREETGALAWSTSLPGPMRSSPAVADGKVLGGSCSPPSMGPPSPPAFIFAVNESTGTPIWSYPVTSPPGDILSSPAIDAGGGGGGKPALVIVGSTGGRVYAFNEFGSLLWQTVTGPIGTSSAAIAANGLVYIGSSTGIFYELNETTGAQQYTYATGGPIYASPSITDGHVLVSSMDGRIYCWGPPFPQHNVMVLKATVSPATVPAGGTVTINYTVANAGNVDETFKVDLAYNTTWCWHPPETPEPTIFHTDTVTLHAGERANGTYTTSFATGNYTVIIRAEQVPGETDLTNNTLIAGNVQVAGPPVTTVAGVVGITGYKLVFKETMRNSIELSVSIDYDWSFSMKKWNGTQWIDAGISGLSTPVSGYIIPGLSTVDLPYYVYLLPASGPNNVAWGNWLNISFTFHWNYSGTKYTTDYTAKLNVHPADIAGATPITFPYLGADGNAGTKDLHVLGVNWGQSSAGADPTSDVARADINGDGSVGTKDLHILGVEWGQTWTNTPP